MAETDRRGCLKEILIFAFIGSALGFAIAESQREQNQQKQPIPTPSPTPRRLPTPSPTECPTGQIINLNPLPGSEPCIPNPLTPTGFNASQITRRKALAVLFRGR